MARALSPRRLAREGATTECRERSCSWYRARVIARQPVVAPCADDAACDRSAGVAHETDQEMYIVQGQQAQAEYLVRREEMPNVRARESATCRAVACVVQWPPVGAEFGTLDVETAVARESGAVAPHARRSDA